MFLSHHLAIRMNLPNTSYSFNGKKALTLEYSLQWHGLWYSSWNARGYDAGSLERAGKATSSTAQSFILHREMVGFLFPRWAVSCDSDENDDLI